MNNQWHLLIVSDDDANRLAVQRALVSAGFDSRVDEEEDPSRVLERVRAERHDCILLDGSLAGTSAAGVDMLQSLRATGVSVPVVALIGQDQDDVAVALMNAGADDYLSRDQGAGAHGDGAQLALRLRVAIGRHRAGERTEPRDSAEHQPPGALREENQLIEILHRIGSSLASQINRDKLIDDITQATTRLTDAEFGVFYHDQAGDAGHESQQTTEEDAGEPSPSGPGISPRLARRFHSADIVRLDDITADPRCAGAEDELGTPPLRSYMAVPVTSSSGTIIGGMGFGHTRAGAFSERDERMVICVAGWAAVAMDNARLYQEVQHAVRARDEVLARVSHDLRNPLNAIAIAAESMLHLEPSPEQRQRYVGAIRRGVERSDRLINNLLIASKIEADKLTLELSRQSVGKLLAQSVRDHEMVAEKRRVALTTEVPADLPKVRVDPTRILQVLDNLVSNALRFTEAGGRVELRAELAEGAVVIAVSDTGAGIPAEDLPQIFNRYWQANQQSRTGTGLGLYIARGIIDAHGGTISVASERGVGTTMRFTLPVAQ